MAAMKYSCLIVLVMMTSTVVCQESFRVNPDHLNKRLLGHVVFDMNVEGIIPCVHTCKFLGACESINFIKKNKLCEINDISSDLASPGELVTEPGTIFGDMTEYPSVMVGKCANHKCGYRQRCYPSGSSYICVDTVSDCLDLLNKFGKKDSGVYSVTTWTGQRKVFCDMKTNGGGWTVFQYRYDGSLEFYRNFSEYENGFGNLKTEFWLGLRYIHEIASQGESDLRIDLEAADGTRAYETLTNFYLTRGPDYALHVGQTTDSSNKWKENLTHVPVTKTEDACISTPCQFSHSLDIGLVSHAKLSQKSKQTTFLASSSPYILGDKEIELFSGFRPFGPHHNSLKFSTHDHGANTHEYNCAKERHGAWWFRNQDQKCLHAHLNGKYLSPGTQDWTGILYISFRMYPSLKASKMMIRRK